MDELLELMNNDSSSIVVPDDDSHTEVQEREKHNVSSVRKRDKNDISRRNTLNASGNATQNRSGPKVRPPSYQYQAQNLARASVDDRLDIRMTNRLVSSDDLSELMTDFVYYSPSVLSAMTLKRLNSLLQIPSQIIDPSTVAGKTENLLTVGIIFSNSGTRISSKGGAFCVLTIGNLNSGPCLTIFLFGEAYGKHCVSCKQGKVIALMDPKLLPANRGDGGGNNKSQNADRTVSFSVYDAGQLKIVANARDYATCKESGCKNYVDRRKSEFCDFHLRRLKRSQGGKQNLNRFQQVKAVHLQGTRTALVDSTARKSNPMTSTSTCNKKSNSIVSTSRKKFNRYLDKIPVKSTQLGNTTAKGTNVGNAGGNSTITSRFGTSKVPMHMAKNKSDQNSNRMYKSSSAVPSAKGTPAKREAETNPDNSIGTKVAKRLKKTSCSGNWLENELANAKEKGPTNTSCRRGFSLTHYTKSKQRTGNETSKPSTLNNKNRLINYGGNDLDGSVVIPQPSRIFQNPTTTFNEISRRTVTPKVESKLTEEIYQKQAEVAQQRKEKKLIKREISNKFSSVSKGRIKTSYVKESANSRSTSTSKSKDVDDFLASMGEFDQEKIRNAKSRFANEVEADEYAKHRRRVDELEKAEASHALRQKKSEKSKITKKWFCQTCGKNYFKKPFGCYAATHMVKALREIQNEITNDGRKNELNKKSSEAGGLRLGEGLSWSYPNHSMG